MYLNGIYSISHIKDWFYVADGIDTLSGEITLSKLIFFPSEKRFNPKGKNLLPLGSKFFPFSVDGSKFFPFWVDPFKEGGWCTGTQPGSQKVISLVKMVKNLPIVSSLLNRYIFIIIWAMPCKNTFTCITKWTVPCENVSFGICRQQRLRSACTSAVWSGPSLLWTEPLDTTECTKCEWRAKARMIFCMCAGWSECACCTCKMHMFKGTFLLDTAHINTTLSLEYKWHKIYFALEIIWTSSKYIAIISKE